MTGSALLVATGILLSRLAGLVRLRVFAHYFGVQSDAADAFSAAFRIPNLLQNLFGEGALSASFIPVYASLLARGDRREADRVAGAVGVRLALMVSVIVLVGVLAAGPLTAVLAPGFTGDKRALTTTIVRVLFPGAGLLVMSAWCLGVLNSHRRFLLSYAAPVLWNAAMIATLLVVGPRTDLPTLAVWLAWGSVAGSALQCLVQVPVVRRVAPDLALRGARTDHVNAVWRGFVPALMSRGVVQVSAFIDQLIASWLPTGAVTALANAQVLYTLPVSLFGLSVAAAELPALAGEAAREEGSAQALRDRLNVGLQQIAIFVIPSAIAFAALGDVIAAALLQTGRFNAADATLIWGILAGSAIGLPASTLGRLYASAYYALRDTRTPFRYAMLRVALATGAGYVAALHVPGWLGVARLWGAAGLTLTSGLAAWVEFACLRGTLNRRIGRTGLDVRVVSVLVLAGLAGAAAGWSARLVLPALHPILTAAVVLPAFGGVFLIVCRVLGVQVAAAWPLPGRSHS